MGSCFSAESRSHCPGSPMPPSTGGRKRKNPRKRPWSRNSSFDYRSEEPLYRIPGRMFLNGSSEVASLFTQQGKKGINQDAMLVWENFGSRTDTICCGVFDGHGPYGHMVAKRVRDSLPLKLSAQWEVNITSTDVHKEISLNPAGSMNSEDSVFVSAVEESRTSVNVEEAEKHPENFQTLRESFLKAFKVMDRELRMHPNIDSFCSGTTAVTLIKQGRDIVIGNVGDSRAILATRDKNESLVAVQLTVDLKPNLPAELERILKFKGRVFALRDEPEVYRVWLPNNNSPGLAMARAFGDFCLKDFGLISVPAISYRRITEKDEFIVLATDGIWDVLSNNEVVDIVASASARSTAARALVESAVRSWRYKYPTSKVDDCAVVCLFLGSDSNDMSMAANTTSKEQLTSVDDVNTETDNEEFSGPTGLDGSSTVRTDNGEVLTDSEGEEDVEEHSEVGSDWSALEGVSRVNTFVSLPRFVPGKEETKARK